MDINELIISLCICLSPFWESTFAEIKIWSVFCLQYMAIGDKHDLMTRANKDVLQRVVEELLDTNSTAELEKK